MKKQRSKDFEKQSESFKNCFSFSQFVFRFSFFVLFWRRSFLDFLSVRFRIKAQFIYSHFKFKIMKEINSEKIYPVYSNGEIICFESFNNAAKLNFVINERK